MGDRMRLRRAESDLDTVDVGKDHEGIGTEVPGQERSVTVLVDDRLDAPEISVRVPDHQVATGPGAHHDCALVHQESDHLEFDESHWQGGSLLGSSDCEDGNETE